MANPYFKNIKHLQNLEHFFWLQVVDMGNMIDCEISRLIRIRISYDNTMKLLVRIVLDILEVYCGTVWRLRQSLYPGMNKTSWCSISCYIWYEIRVSSSELTELWRRTSRLFPMRHFRGNWTLTKKLEFSIRIPSSHQ